MKTPRALCVFCGARSGHDPAYGSGPLATILQDLLSLSIYFGTVSLLIGR